MSMDAVEFEVSLMIHEVKASGKMKVDGVPVKAGALLATIITEHPLDDIMAAIRCGQVTVSVTKEPEKTSPVQPPDPPADEPTTIGVKPTLGK
jgi:hypothetical protein